MGIATLLAVAHLVVGIGPAVAQTSVRAMVECQGGGRGYFSFSAGRDRCWEPIDGKLINPKSAMACAVQRSDSVLSVTFRYSEQEKIQCDSGKVATREQAEKALPLLGKREREFYETHAK